MSNKLSANLRALISREVTEGDGVIGEITKSYDTSCDYFIKQLINIPEEEEWSYSTTDIGLQAGQEFDSIINKTAAGIYTDNTGAPGGAGFFQASGDALLFGHNTPFETILFSTSIANAGTYVLSYSNSFGTSAWASVTIYYDGTDGFANTGDRKILDYPYVEAIG